MFSSLSLQFPAVKTGAGTKHTKKSVTPAYRKYKFYFAPPLSLKTCYTVFQRTVYIMLSSGGLDHVRQDSTEDHPECRQYLRPG